MSWLRVALCQINPVVGDLHGNVRRITDALGQASAAGAQLAVFPELSITGYPPEDLLLKPGFVSDNLAALEEVASATEGCAAVVGFVDRSRDLFNAAAICAHGRVSGVYHKQNLPNYSVFDEQRYFAPGAGARELYLVGGAKIGLSVCEDAWDPIGPVAAQAAGGADIVVNINASPFYAGRVGERCRMLGTRSADASCALLYVNTVGGQDELVFDGGSMAFDQGGRLVASLPLFEERVGVFDFEFQPAYRKRLLDPRGRHIAAALPVVTVTGGAKSPAGESPAGESPAGSSAPRARTPVAGADHGQAPRAPALDPLEEIYAALVLGVADYVRKNGFSEVVVGMSGGIDSSLVAVIAADALGGGAVHGVSMPSRYTSQASNDDAAELARAIGADYTTVPIEPAYEAMLHMLEPAFAGTVAGLAEENIQSRLRGVVLMGLSNKFGWLVLTTGNKSELAVGYSTLYGDTAGGFAVIKDVPKTLVYRLSRWRNSISPVIPEAVLDKAPTAELRENQLDTDSLPPYEALDPALEAYVERDLTASEMAEAGFDPQLVERVARLVDLAEYKRRQSPIGARVSPKAFGRDRRMPITNGYR
ncbi:MAG TPA: NAD+ synthase [Acidimicrobiales bacterium]|nr:NAD+ synthase [Acidimicrobiales bacterium]